MDRMRDNLNKLGRQMLDLVYPRECLVTGSPVEAESPCRFLSREGMETIFYIAPPHCRTCGAPFYGEMLGLRDCPHCRELNPAFAEGRSVWLLRDAGREIIHELKYNKGRHLLPDIQTLVRQRNDFMAFLTGGVLVPVPLHPLRERERGYNQSRLIAQQLAGTVNGELQDLLVRVKYTETQTRLDRAARQKNMRSAFSLADKARVDPAQRYILVDDVFTTGSTLNSAAQELRRAGAQRVDVATLGHG